MVVFEHVVVAAQGVRAKEGMESFQLLVLGVALEMANLVLGLLCFLISRGRSLGASTEDVAPNEMQCVFGRRRSSIRFRNQHFFLGLGDGESRNVL